MRIGRFLFLLILVFLGCSREIVKSSHLEASQGVIQGASRETRASEVSEWKGADSVVITQYVHDTLRVVQKVYKPASIVNTRDTLYRQDTLYKQETVYVRDTLYRQENPQTAGEWFLSKFWWAIIVGAGALAFWLRGKFN